MIIDGTTSLGDGGPKPAAEGFDLEARKGAIYDWVRQVRGGVLAGTFSVERHISSAIIHFMMGERLGKIEVQSAFDEGLLTPLSFERRISVVMLVAPHVLSENEVVALKGDLNRLRTLRNAMAHRPFWFLPELNDSGEVVNVVPMIQRGKAPVALTTSFITQTNEQIAGLIERTAKLAAAVAEREAKGQQDVLPPAE